MHRITFTPRGERDVAAMLRDVQRGSTGRCSGCRRKSGRWPSPSRCGVPGSSVPPL